MATEAFESVYPNNSGDDIWVSLAAIEEGKSADEQLAKLCTVLGSRASDERLRKAIENLLRPAGDPLFSGLLPLMQDFQGTHERLQLM